MPACWRANQTTGVGRWSKMLSEVSVELPSILRKEELLIVLRHPQLAN